MSIKYLCIATNPEYTLHDYVGKTPLLQYYYYPKEFDNFLFASPEKLLSYCITF
jgi:hypothetical protein